VGNTGSDVTIIEPEIEIAIF